MTARTYEFVQLDFFTRTPLTGNPLAVCLHRRARPDRQEMQALAREMNLSDSRPRRRPDKRVLRQHHQKKAPTLNLDGFKPSKFHPSIRSRDPSTLAQS